jgi:hypothetical protein
MRNVPRYTKLQNKATNAYFYFDKREICRFWDSDVVIEVIPVEWNVVKPKEQNIPDEKEEPYILEPPTSSKVVWGAYYRDNSKISLFYKEIYFEESSWHDFGSKGVESAPLDWYTKNPKTLEDNQKDE